MNNFTLDYLVLPEYSPPNQKGERFVLRKQLVLFCNIPELLTHSVTLICSGKIVATKPLENETHFTLEADIITDQLLTIKIAAQFYANALLHGDEWVIDNTELQIAHLKQIGNHDTRPLIFNRIAHHLVPRALPAKLIVNQANLGAEYYLVAPNLHCRLPVKTARKTTTLTHLPHSMVVAAESRSYLEADVVQRNPATNQDAKALFRLSGKPHFRFYWHNDSLVYQRLTENNLTQPLLAGESLLLMDSRSKVFAMPSLWDKTATVEQLVFGEAGKSLALYLWRTTDHLWVRLQEDNFNPRYYLLLAPSCYADGRLVKPVTVKIPDSADSFTLNSINDYAVHYQSGDKQLISSFSMAPLAVPAAEPVV